MKINKIVALCAFLAISFIGAAENLPFGETSMRQYAATNISTVAIYFAQFDEESGAETIFYESQLGIKFKTYNEFMNYVRGLFVEGEPTFMQKINLLNTNAPMVIYLAAGKPSPSGDFYYSFSGYEYVDLKMYDGVWKFPTGYIEGFVPKFDDYMAIRLSKPVMWAKFVSIDLVTGRVIVHDTRINAAQDREVKVDGSKTLLVRKDYLTNDPNKKVILTVGFAFGIVKAWGGDGIEIPLPAPSLSLVSDTEGIGLILDKGDVGSNVTIQCSEDLKVWNTFASFQVLQYTTRIPIQSSNPPACYFRIAN